MCCKLDSTENPRSFEKYPTPQDKTTPARVGMKTFGRPMVASGDLLGLNLHDATAFMSQARTK